MTSLFHESDVGVVVGRFQEDELHEGHVFLISEVFKRHHHVLIILGCQASFPTDRDPLTFAMREEMLHHHFSSRPFNIASLVVTRESYAYRSHQIDELITVHFPGRRAIIYGSRDSVIHKYAGTHETCEIETIFPKSATEVRKGIDLRNSADFRAGVIYSHMKRFPIAYPAVDIAAVRRPTKEVLLVGKPSEQAWRFPGGFFDLKLDKSFEDAAGREFGEEVPGVKITRPRIITSMVVDDWRYRNSKDRIVTSLTLADWIKGEPQGGGDDVNRAQWFHFSNFYDALVPEHRPLGETICQLFGSFRK